MRDEARDKARDKARDTMHKTQDKDITHKTPDENTYTSSLLVQYTTAYQNSQYRAKKQVDLLHSNGNGNSTSKKQSKKYNTQDTQKHEIKQETQCTRYAKARDEVKDATHKTQDKDKR